MSLIVKIGADSSAFKRAINTVSKDVQGLGTGLSKMGNVFKPVSVAAAGIFTAAIKSGAEFESKMSEVSAIGQIYGSELDELTEKAKKIGLETKFTASEAADGLKYMGQAGWSAKESLEGIDAVMTLAAAGAIDVGRASDIVTDAITALGYSAKDSAKFVDILAVTASKSNTDVNLMGDSFKFASQIAGTLGVNIEDLSLALGLMANASVKGQTAGTSLRAGLVNLAKPTKQMKQAMEKYNVALVTNKDGSVNLRDTMVQLRKSMSGLNETQKANALGAIFGKTALSGWAAIVNATDSDFNKLADAIDNSTGAAKEMQETMMDNRLGDIQLMISSIDNALQSVFKAIAPMVTEVAQGIKTLADKFAELDEGTQKFIVTGLAIGGLIPPITKVLGAVIKLGAKIAAIPSALNKIDNRRVERQVSAWLKWNKVSEEQAAKLRKVARDMDLVKRGGAGAENAAKRLNKAFKELGIDTGIDDDIDDIGDAATRASKKIKRLGDDMKVLNTRWIRVNGESFDVNAKDISNTIGRKIKIEDVKVDGKSVKVDKSSVKKKVKGEGIGKEIGEDIASEMGEFLGSNIGEKFGPIGTLIGSILGETAGEGLATALSGSKTMGKLATSMGTIGTFLGGIASAVFNPITLGALALGGAIWGISTAVDKSSKSFNAFETQTNAAGEKVKTLGGNSEVANAQLDALSKTWLTIGKDGNVKTLTIEVGMNFAEDGEARRKQIEETVHKFYDQQREYAKNNQLLTEEDKRLHIEELNRLEERHLANLLASNERQTKAQEEWGSKLGWARYNAGLRMVEEDLARMRDEEKNLAASEEEKGRIQLEYEEKMRLAKAKFVEENHKTISQGFKDEIKQFASIGEEKIKLAYREKEEHIRIAGEKYGIASDIYKRIVAEEELAFEGKKKTIINGVNEEIGKSKEKIETIKQEIAEMKRNGLISSETARTIYGELDKVASLEFQDKEIKISAHGKDETESFLVEVDKWTKAKESKIVQLALEKSPYNEEMLKTKTELDNLGRTETRPTVGMNRTPWGEGFNGINKDIETLNGTTANPKIDGNIVEWDGKKILVEDALANLDATEVAPIINAEPEKFKGHEEEVRRILADLEVTESSPDINADTFEFDGKKYRVTKDIENIDSQTPTPTTGMNITPFYNGKGEVMGQVRFLNGTVATVTSDLDESGAQSGHWSLSNWIAQRPIVQRVKTVWDKFTGKTPDGHRATGGQIGSGTTVVGERGPELVSRRGNSVTVQPLRATDRAMGGWSDKDLVGGKGGDVYNVTIIGANKSAREMFDEIEQYKNTVSRNKGTRRF